MTTIHIMKYSYYETYEIYFIISSLDSNESSGPNTIPVKSRSDRYILQEVGSLGV